MNSSTPQSPEFQLLVKQVETALAKAAIDARELAERTKTPLIVQENISCAESLHLKAQS